MQQHGWDLTVYDEAFLTQSLARRLTVISLSSSKAYLDRLLEDRHEAEVFFRSLSISYSEFFRNPLTFAVLEQLVLPGLVEAMEESRRSELRIWSAGCAAGQEAYSVAILLEEMAAARGRPIPLRIIATDVCEDELARARAGVYDTSAVQNVRLKQLRDHFTRDGETYVVAPRLRERVDFSTYNLLDERSTSPPASIYGDFDLILCSNVLLYYRPKTQGVILSKVRRSLAHCGYFVTGEVESEIVKRAGGFRKVAPPAAVFKKAAG